MLKHKISVAILAIILMFSLLIPVVNAENETDKSATPEASKEQNSSEDPQAVGSTNESENHSHSEGSSNENMKKEDVYLIGDNITIDYVIDGNLFVLANNVTINSQIGGDAFICAAKINIEKDGYIFSNLFAASKELNISGVVYDLYTTSGNVSINGYIYRDVHITSENFNLNGTIGRNAFISSKNFNFPKRENENSEEFEMFSSDSGMIYGNMNYSAPEELSIPDGLVAGSINYDKSDSSTKTIGDYIMDLGSFVATVAIIWLLIIWLAPRFLEKSVSLISTKFWPTIGFGALSVLAVIIASIILLILGITAKVALLSIGLIALLLCVGVPVFTISLNNFICNKLKLEKKIIVLGMLIATCIVIWLTTLIPFVGGFINLIIKIIGLGIIVNYVFMNRNKNSKKENSKTEKTSK